MTSKKDENIKVSQFFKTEDDFYHFLNHLEIISKRVTSLFDKFISEYERDNDHSDHLDEVLRGLAAFISLYRVELKGIIKRAGFKPLEEDGL